MIRSIVLAGNYGSGKTEIALNMSLRLAQKGRCALVDMDIVNPYFRSAEHAGMLASAGVRLIAPTFANTTVDVPVISAEVEAAFTYDYAVFDAGGDPVGAAALGSVARFFDAERTSFLYVVNARRPLQQTASEIVTMLRQIEARARLPISGLVNNTNLARETTAADVRHGAAVLAEVTRITGIGVALTCAPHGVSLDSVAGETLALDIYTRPDWLDSTV